VFAAAHNDHPLTRSYPAAFAARRSLRGQAPVRRPRWSSPTSCAARWSPGARPRLTWGRRGRAGDELGGPHLAGIAARLLSLRPGLKPFELKTLLYLLYAGRKRTGPAALRCG